MFGPECEVVLHDLSLLPHSIVAIENGAVTGRTVGDVPTDRMLRNLRNTGEADDVRVYVSTHDGRILKSLAVTLRDEDGEPFGLLGINYDVSEVVRARHALESFASVGGATDGSAPETGEVFSGDIRDVVAGMVTRILDEMGKTPPAMTREEKMEVVKRLELRGAFLVKRSAEQVAEALDLSRYTIFAYLKEIRHGAGEQADAERLIGDPEPGHDRCPAHGRHHGRMHVPTPGRSTPCTRSSRAPAAAPSPSSAS